MHRKLISVGGRLEFCPPKSEAGKRTVTLPATVVDVLRHHLKFNVGTDDPAARCSPGTRAHRYGRARSAGAVDWPDAVKAADLPEGFHFHDLRHVGNLLAVEAGASNGS